VALAAAEDMVTEPRTYEEALQSPEAARWRQAMDEELAALEKNGTWKLCEAPAGAKVLGSKWAYKVKRDESGRVVRYKARLVAQGFAQVEGLDFLSTYAPVARLSSIRVILALAAREDWHVDNMDVDNAYLQSPVEEEVFMRQPKGYVQHGAKGRVLVCRVHKSLYGLKQSANNWYGVINGWLKKYGFKASQADVCVYVLRKGDLIVIIALYVDDLLLASNDRKLLDQVKRDISTMFSMKDLGELRFMLGMEVVRDRAAKTIEIRQPAYVDQVLERYGMSDCKPVMTPAQDVLVRATEGTGEPDVGYMSLVGSVLYPALVSRPDISFAVQALGRHMQASAEAHHAAAKRVLRYLKGTREMGICYGKDVRTGDGELLTGYSDSDWAGDVDTRRSVTAYVYQIAGGAVSWSSRLQATVALSSTEAEYMALCAAAQEGIQLRQLLADLGFEQKGPTVIYDDNQGCVALAQSARAGKRTKHIDVRYHFVRERVEGGELKVVYVPTERQLADLLTKALERVKLERLRERVLGYVTQG
jgi:hypothetical protein